MYRLRVLILDIYKSRKEISSYKLYARFVILAMYTCYAVTICLSVRPSHAGIV